jgi:hypothetical protein
VNPRVAQALVGGLLIVGLLGALAFTGESCAKKQATQAEAQANEAKGEANAHAHQAQNVPDHAQELAEAQAGVDRARQEVERLRRLLASKPVIPVPDPVGPDPALPAFVAADDRDTTIAALNGLVRAQDTQIGTLKLALTDKTRQSEEWRLAFEAERRRAVGLEIALDAQKHVAASGKWVGRFQGFVAGAALGYVGAKR